MRRIALIVKRLSLYLAVAVLGFVVGVVALYIYWVRSGPSLQLWHTEELTAEFTAERADEIRTFDDYQRLEDRLFAQLEERNHTHMRRIALIVKRLGLYLAVAVLGFVVGVVALYIYWVRSGPSLQLWHTEELTAEFTAERADEIRTFDDYQRLEDRLFAQLEERIYARTETGPAFTLARYSAGSVADPHRRKPNWNRSFEFPAEAPAGGMLLLHGMSDSPYSLRALGEALNKHDYWVIGLRLPGHGTGDHLGSHAVRDQPQPRGLDFPDDELQHAGELGPGRFGNLARAPVAPQRTALVPGPVEQQHRCIDIQHVAQEGGLAQGRREGLPESVHNGQQAYADQGTG